jgi:hypothetical protein
VKRLRVPRALLLAGVAAGVVIAAMALVRPLWLDRGGVSVDVGPIAGLQLQDAWTKVAEAAGVPSDSAEIEDLMVDYTSDGLLVHFLLQAWTHRGKSISVGYEAYGAADLASRRVTISGGVAEAATGVPRQTAGLVGTVLSTIDRVGTAAVLAKLPDVGANGFYSFGSVPTRGYPDAIPAVASAYVWDGAAFATLAATDARRTYGGRYVFLAVTPVATTRGAAAQAAGGGIVSTTMTGRSLAPTYFVVPLPAPSAGTSKE